MSATSIFKGHTVKNWADGLSLVQTAQLAGRESDLLIEDLIELQQSNVISEAHINWCLRALAIREQPNRYR